VARFGLGRGERPAAWAAWSGASALAGAAPLGYPELVCKAAEPPAQGGLPGPLAAQIEQDLLRTFPSRADFASEGAPGVRKLRRVLQAYALATGGYLQGQNYLAAQLLVVMGDEAGAFWVLRALCDRMFGRYFSGPGADSMEGLKADIGRVTRRLDTELPEVMAHLREHGMGDLTLFCPKWYLCLFVNTLPEEVLLRVWDNVILRAGAWEEALFAVTVALLKASAGAVLAAGGLSEIFEAVKGAGEGVWDVSGFLQSCFGEGRGAGATPEPEPASRKRRSSGGGGVAARSPAGGSAGAGGATPTSARKRRRAREAGEEAGGGSPGPGAGGVVPENWHGAAKATPPSAKRPRRVALSVSTIANSPAPARRPSAAKGDPETPKVPLTPMSRSLWQNVVQAVTPSKKKGRRGRAALQRTPRKTGGKSQCGRSLLGQALDAVLEGPGLSRGEGGAIGTEAAALVCDWLELAHMDSPAFPSRSRSRKDE